MSAQIPWLCRATPAASEAKPVACSAEGTTASRRHNRRTRFEMIKHRGDRATRRGRSWVHVVVAVWGAIAAVHPVQGRDLYVAPCGSDANPGRRADCSSAQGPKRTIQAAIDQIRSGATVYVLPGVYNERIDLLGKAIHIEAVENASNTILDGTGLTGSVVTCVNGEPPEAILSGLTITGGSATYGAGMYISSSSPTLIACTFRANRASGWGGGVYVHDSQTTIDACTFEANSAESTGGAMYMVFASPVMSGCLFQENSALQGAVFRTYFSQPVVRDSTFVNNSAYTGGGAIDIYFHTDLQMEGCTLTMNTAGLDVDINPYARAGGAFHSTSSSAVLSNCEISENTANYGGAMSLSRSSFQLFDCLIRDNRAEGGNGGALESGAESTVHIERCTFTGNTAQLRGGAVYNYRSAMTSDRSVFEQNRAGQGGAIASMDHTNVVVRRTQFIANHSSQHGGGMYNGRYADSIVVQSCSFLGNTAQDSGGGMANFWPDPFIVANCLFAGNHAEEGGGLSSGYGILTLSQSTFYANTASARGGGVFTTRPITVENCVLWNNETQGVIDRDAQLSDDFLTSVINYSLINGGWESRDAVGIIDADPRFEDELGPDGVVGTGDENFMPRLGSPLVDAGDNLAIPPDLADLDGDGNTVERIPFDLGGGPRRMDIPTQPDGGNGTQPMVDIGAYELWPCTEPDSDVDRLCDELDQCPNTPSGEPVDVHGCSCNQRDSDHDGVEDCTDECPATPLDIQVGIDGCRVPGDFDGDGCVGLGDLPGFTDCMAGPGNAPNPSGTSTEDCLAIFDLAATGTVDLRDYAVFATLPAEAAGTCGR